jgi:hypothetical protein
MRAEFLHEDGGMDKRSYAETDRQTDITKLILVIRNFTNVPKIPVSLYRLVDKYYFNIYETQLHSSPF